MHNGTRTPRDDRVGPPPAELDGPDGSDGPRGAEVPAALESVRDSTLRLLAGLPRPPSALRVSAGGVTIEAEWPAEPAPSETPVAASAVAPAAGGTVAGEAQPPEDGEEERRQVRAPAVGTFFRAPEPGAAPFVTEGDTVTAGQQVAIVEVMKLMIPVNAESAGRVVAIHKDDGAPVEFDEPLFALAPVQE